MVVLVKPVVLVLVVEPVVALLLSVVVLVEPVVRLRPVVLVEPLLLAVVLSTVVVLLSVVVLLTVVVLRSIVVLLTVVLFPPAIAEGPNVDISREAWHALSPSVASDRLWHSSVRDSVLVQDCFRRPVPSASERTGASVAAITQLSKIPLASGVGRPCTIGCANRVDVWTGGTVKPASAMKESSGTISGDSRTKSRNLLFYSRFVLHTSGDVRPCSVLLAEGYIVSAGLTHNLAGLAGERLGTISRESRTSRKCRRAGGQGS